MILSEVKKGEEAIILKIKGTGAFRKRISEMGFVKGKRVKVVKKTPLNGPIEYHILGYNVSLRKNEASLIEVSPLNTADREDNYYGTFDEKLLPYAAKKGKVIDVAIVGNPNCGKSSIFNTVSGENAHTGNYSGVTVGIKTGQYELDTYIFNLVDLPGTYSLSAYTKEEVVTRNYIIEKAPDVILNVLDASNLERNLFLTTQLIDMDLKVVGALNMYDELKKAGDKLDYQTLGALLGIPLVPTIGTRGDGLEVLFRKIIEVFENREPIVRHIHINYGKGVEKSIKAIRHVVDREKELTSRVSARFIAIKLFEKDEEIKKLLRNKVQSCDKILKVSQHQIRKLENHLQEDSSTLITNARYGFISGALKETFQANEFSRKEKTDTEIIDTFLTHKIFGFPILLFFLWLMFTATFRLGNYPMLWLDTIIQSFGNLAGHFLPGGVIRDMLVDGVIAGVGGVLVFLPNILILFFFISFMEDTGYMARAAFIMDRSMHKIGLHGKSFIPMIMGFGCNVPAIMSTRTLRNRNERLLTILINPFMSCSARLPVYILIISAFFKGKETMMLALIYLIGIGFAVFFAILFKKTLFKHSETPFVMELPPYRMPSLRSTLTHMWHKGQQYLKKMGGLILIASIVIWALGYFPRSVQMQEKYQNKRSLVLQNKTLDSTTIHQKIRQIDLQEQNEQQARSYIGQLGKIVQPMMSPLGFDWRMSVSLLSGVVAKEVVVSTMGVLYQADAENDNLERSLQNASFAGGKRQGEKIFDPVTAFAFLMFVLLYFPCVSVFAAVRSETGSWKWPVFLVFYTTLTAWTVSFLVYQIGHWIG
jgi:ferrous iron transport protein B